MRESRVRLVDRSDGFEETVRANAGGGEGLAGTGGTDAGVAGNGVFFPEEVVADPWIVYHGTSGALEGRIDEHGLDSGEALVPSEVIARVQSVFAALEWEGEHSSGFPVLGSYSRFDVDHGRPVYLAESPSRALTFASVDFAGGECARALHYSLEDLASLVCGTAGTDGTPAVTTDTNRRVCELLDELGELRARLREIRAGHRYGVIYAIRLRPVDLLNLRHHKTMGFMHRGPIAADRIHARCRVAGDGDRTSGSDRQRLGVLLDGPLLAYIELATALRSAMPDAGAGVLAGTLTELVAELDRAGATREEIFKCARGLRGPANAGS